MIDTQENLSLSMEQNYCSIKKKLFFPPAKWLIDCKLNHQSGQVMEKKLDNFQLKKAFMLDCLFIKSAFTRQTLHQKKKKENVSAGYLLLSGCITHFLGFSAHFLQTPGKILRVYDAACLFSRWSFFT